jgi:hypothetical protein
MGIITDMQRKKGGKEKKLIVKSGIDATHNKQPPDHYNQ